MVQRTLSWMALAGAMALALPGMAMAAAPTMKGDLLVDGKGMTLYTYSEDTETNSACTGDCAAAWPPALLGAGDTAPDDSNWSVLKRADGKQQWVLMGSPLYTYKADTKPGDKKGDGKVSKSGGNWVTATMDGAD